MLTAPATGHNRGGECGIKRPLLYLSKKDKALHDLNNAEGYIKSILCKRKLPLRVIPELEFVYDESIEYGMKIEKILENTKRED